MKLHIEKPMDIVKNFQSKPCIVKSVFFKYPVKTGFFLFLLIQSFLLDAQYLTDLTSVSGSSNPIVNSVADGTLPNGIVVNISEKSSSIVFANNFSTNNSLCYFNSTSYNPHNQNNTDAINMTIFPTATAGTDSVIVTFSSPLNEFFMYIKELDYSKMVFPSIYKISKIIGNSQLIVDTINNEVKDFNSNNSTNLTCNSDPNSAEGIVKIKATNITRFAFCCYRNNSLNFGDAYLLNFGLTAPVAALPINLINFSAVSDDCGINLQWKMETELNCDRFEVEHSIDGINFNRAATVASKGFSSNYYLKMNSLKGDNCYVRLKIIEKDGGYKYSATIKRQLNCMNTLKMQLFPNPINGTGPVSINFNSQSEEKVKIKIYSSIGELIFLQNAEVFKGVNSIKLELPSLQPGIYYVKTENEQSEIIGTVLQLMKI